MVEHPLEGLAAVPSLLFAPIVVLLFAALPGCTIVTNLPACGIFDVSETCFEDRDGDG